MEKSTKHIFKSGSTTYYYSSFFFPKDAWNKVATIYAYVRTIDNYVDEIPQQKKRFLQSVTDTEAAWSGKKITDRIITNFISLAKKNDFEYSWIQAFLRSMENDLYTKKYSTYSKLNEYIFGSAAVIGLFMASILKLPKESFPFAQKQGEAMQLINFIRDIAEDCTLGRQYIPQEDLEMFSITKLCSPPKTTQEKENFKKLIQFEIKRYKELQEAAEQGYKYIPYRFRVPIATAAALYLWTANTIYKDPMIIYQKKVKPHKIRVLLTGLRMAYKWK